MARFESDGNGPHVVFVSPWLRQYNAKFLGILRERLDDLGVRMDVVHGQPTGTDAGRGDTAAPEWATEVDQRKIGWGQRGILWQPYIEVMRTADLVIVQQASKLLLNYILLVRQALGGPHVAFWGHGRNFQASSIVQRAAEHVKGWLTRRSHWFFAYNDLTERVLVEHGFPAERITVVKNSVDTRSLSEARDRVSAQDVSRLRESLNLEGTHVGIFCGAMYPGKRLDFLLEAAVEIRSRVPDFELICVGDGVDRHLVDRAADEHDWIHAVGPQFGDALARYFAVASVCLLPYLVGLTIVDSFVLATPMVTTTEPGHGPEIEYLQNGFNGLMVEDPSVERYAEAVADVLTNEDLRTRLVNGCILSAKEYSMEGMAERFASGVLLALDSR